MKDEGTYVGNLLLTFQVTAEKKLFLSSRLRAKAHGD